jgi:hypothetical protein
LRCGDIRAHGGDNRQKRGIPDTFCALAATGG